MVNRNKVTLKGFVYAIPDGMLWQNIEMVLKGKVNFFVRVESTAKDIIMSSKVEILNKNDYMQKYLKPRLEEDEDNEDDKMRNVKRYLWDTDPKVILRLEEDMEELDSRLQEYFNSVSKTYQGLFNNLYASQFVVLDTMNNSLSDCIDKIEKSVKSNWNKLTPY